MDLHAFFVVDFDVSPKSVLWKPMGLLIESSTVCFHHCEGTGRIYIYHTSYYTVLQHSIKHLRSEILPCLHIKRLTTAVQNFQNDEPFSLFHTWHHLITQFTKQI